jgi:hypothetical protein
MAKDAKGHGSEKRGASGSTHNAVQLDGRAMPSKSEQLARQNAFAAAVARSDADKAAASKLAEGGAPGKNTPVPVHPGAAGRAARVAREAGAVQVHDYTGRAGSINAPGAAGRQFSEEGNEYNRDLALRLRNGQVGSGMKFRG